MRDFGPAYDGFGPKAGSPTGSWEFDQCPPSIDSGHGINRLAQYRIVREQTW